MWIISEILLRSYILGLIQLNRLKIGHLTLKFSNRRAGEGFRAAKYYIRQLIWRNEKEQR